MGVYDTVGEENIQIKCTLDPEMVHYDIGNSITLADGLYIGYEGWFVVKKQKVKMTGKKVFDKWGNRLKHIDIINPSNPVVQAIKGV